MIRSDIEWKRLRYCLGLSQEGMGNMMGLTRYQVARIEHYISKPRKLSLIFLEAWLNDPDVQERLSTAGYPLKDITDAKPLL